MRLNAQVEGLLARTPIQVLGLALSVVVLTAGLAVAVTRDPDGARQLQTMSRDPAVPTTVPGAEPLAPSSIPGSPPPLEPPQPGPSPGVAPPPPANTVPGLTPPPILVPERGPNPSPPAPAIPVALCSPAQIDQTLTTDKPAYAAGETVNVSVSVQNVSSNTCSVVEPDSTCYSLLSAFGAGDDRPFWRSRTLPAVPCRVFPRRALAPGAGAQFAASWDQSDGRSCSPSAIDASCLQPRVPGPYTIRSSWLAQAKTTTIELLP